MEDFELSEQDGFKVVYFPNKTNIREFGFKYFQTEYHFLLEELKFIVRQIMLDINGQLIIQIKKQFRT